MQHCLLCAIQMHPLCWGSAGVGTALEGEGHLSTGTDEKRKEKDIFFLARLSKTTMLSLWPCFQVIKWTESWDKMENNTSKTRVLSILLLVSVYFFWSHHWSNNNDLEPYSQLFHSGKSPAFMSATCGTHTSILEQRKPQPVHGLSPFTCILGDISRKTTFLKARLLKKSLEQTPQSLLPATASPRAKLPSKLGTAQHFFNHRKLNPRERIVRCMSPIHHFFIHSSAPEVGQH